jgi:hypothetical protein
MSMTAQEILSQYRRGGGDSFFLENIAKLREFSQNLGVCKCNTLKLNKSHRSLTTALVKYSHSSEI